MLPIKSDQAKSRSSLEAETKYSWPGVAAVFGSVTIWKVSPHAKKHREPSDKQQEEPYNSESLHCFNSFSAGAVSYTPGQNTFSAQATNVQTTPGRNLISCLYATYEDDARFSAVFEAPMFGDAFRDLRREPDGRLKSDGERTFEAGQTSCTTNYSLTLRQARN
jgi:hypothetical protein